MLTKYYIPIYNNILKGCSFEYDMVKNSIRPLNKVIQYFFLINNLWTDTYLRLTMKSSAQSVRCMIKSPWIYVNQKQPTHIEGPNKI